MGSGHGGRNQRGPRNRGTAPSRHASMGSGHGGRNQSSCASRCACNRVPQWGPATGAGIRLVARENNTTDIPASMGSGHGGRNQTHPPEGNSTLGTLPQWGPATGAGIRWKKVRLVQVELLASMGSGHGGRNQAQNVSDTALAWLPQWGPATGAGISVQEVGPGHVQRGLNGVRPRGPESGLARNRACDLGLYRSAREVLVGRHDAAAAALRMTAHRVPDLRASAPWG